MKRKFSKIMSLLLTVVMLMSLIQLPVFASTPVMRDDLANYNNPIGTETKQHRSWLAPYGDEVSHFDYYAVDGDKPIEYYLDGGSPDSTALSIGNDGIYRNGI